MEHIVSVDHNDRYLPGYQIDFRLRSQYAKSALSVLESLEGSQLITGKKIENISIQKDQENNKERLFPDIVLGNSERSTFAIVELKRSSQTEREAITELLAYTIELKNHLPHIADRDINLVIISTEFNVLLDHSIASLLLGSKFNILALKVKEDANDLSVEIYIPSAWTDIWQNDLPQGAFSSITLAAEKKEANTSTQNIAEVATYEILDDMIMFEGAKNNSHGFYLIWRDMRKSSDAGFCITLYQIKPSVFLQSSLNAGFKINTEEPLSKFILFNDNDCNIIDSLYKMADVAKEFLSEHYNVSYKDPSSWSNHMNAGSEFRTYALPFGFNSWGNIGEFIRANYFHPALPDRKGIESINMGLFKYKDPAYGIETINFISGLTLFNNGVFNARALYEFAKQLNYYYTVAGTLYNVKQQGKNWTFLKPRLFFSALDMICSLREIGCMVNTCKEKFHTNVEFKIWLYDVDESPSENIEEYIDWFIKSFLKNAPFYQDLFLRFVAWGILYSNDRLLDRQKADFKCDLEKLLIEFVKEHLFVIMERLYLENSIIYKNDVYRLLSSGYFNGNRPTITSKDDIIHAIKQIDNSTILDTFETIFIELLNLTESVVFHALTPTDSMEIDWENLRSHLVKRFNEGERFGAIFIYPNGSISIGILNQELQYDWLKISDPEKEVIIVNIGGIGRLRKVSWAGIMDGTTPIE